MNTASVLATAVGGSTQLRTALVSLRQDDGSVAVTLLECGTDVCCDMLHTADASVLALNPGDTVLVWRRHETSKRGLVIGRIGPAEPPPTGSAGENRESPEELVIEAKKNLTLKCGEGSITIREDGKILIKGKDLVSHAQRMNRIKGGSVSIN
jgi:hypothetical protein